MVKLNSDFHHLVTGLIKLGKFTMVCLLNVLERKVTRSSGTIKGFQPPTTIMKVKYTKGDILHI